MTPDREVALVRAAQFAVIAVIANLAIAALFGWLSFARLLLNMLLVWSALMLLWVVQVYASPRLQRRPRDSRDSDSPQSN